MINLMDLELTTMDANLNNYSTFIHGLSKLGKTTFVNKMYGQKALIIATEDRFKHISNAYIQRVNSWVEFKTVMTQLNNPRMKEKFDVVVIDTVDNLAIMLEKAICVKHKEQKLGDRKDIWGADWSDVKNEWRDGMNLICNMGYTPCFVGHSTQKALRIPISELSQEAANAVGANIVDVSEKDEVGNKIANKYFEIDQYVPDLNPRYLTPINKMVDNILFMNLELDQNGEEQRVLHLRQTLQYQAGCTFTHIQPTILATPEAYRDAIEKAIELEEGEKEIKVKESHKEIDFKSVMEEAITLGKKFVDGNKRDDLTRIIDGTVGVGTKLTECSADQAETVQLAILKMKEYIENNNL